MLGTGWFGAVAADVQPGKTVAVVGVSHGVQLPGEELFYAEVHLHGGPAPVRRFLPDLIRLIEERAIDPGRVFDLILPLSEAAEGYGPWTNAVPSRPCCVPDAHPRREKRRAHANARP